MTTRPPAAMRRQVVERARGCCEYCLIDQDVAASTHQIDHVIAEKHGGSTTAENLALSCTPCNRRKSSDISSRDQATGEIIPLFNPRTQNWDDHFKLEGARIIGITATGRTTVHFLLLNSFERLAERATLMRVGHYPPSGLSGTK